MKSNCSEITVTSAFQKYFNFVPMLESWKMDPLKINFSCEFFVTKFCRTSQFLETLKII